ncbi:hypothetical protein B0H16DRAFT_1473361 [Mycena metata]|uniref:Uncharacterized protein n=1 Tax=Mycena metata TaxID=1033252 RepID=A0AAD7MM35_9AGAR|nr:hypothetical protein B0H16DRAFT_1473361 [Mycena metata]
MAFGVAFWCPGSQYSLGVGYVERLVDFQPLHNHLSELEESLADVKRKNAENKDTNETAIIPSRIRRPSFNLKPPPLNPPSDPLESPLEESESLLDELEELDDPEFPAAVVEEAAALTVPTLPPVFTVVLPVATVVPMPVPLDVPETDAVLTGNPAAVQSETCATSTLVRSCEMTLAIDTLLRDVVRYNASVNHADIALCVAIDHRGRAKRGETGITRLSQRCLK